MLYSTAGDILHKIKNDELTLLVEKKIEVTIHSIKNKRIECSCDEQI